MPLTALTTLAAATLAASPTSAPAGHLTTHVTARPAAVSAPASAAWRSYRVRPGDTLGYLAAASGTSVRSLQAVNGIADPNHILVGRRLLLPARPGATGTTGTTRTTRTTRPVRRAGQHVPGGSRAHARSATRTTPTTSPTTSPATTGRRYGRAQVGRLIGQIAASQGVDPRLARAVATQESGWNQDARSSVGAIGVMQVMPANQAWLSQVVGRPLDLTDTRDNITAGVALLRHLTARADLDTAIGSYYQGLGSMRARGPLPETRRYVANVRALMGRS